MLRPNDEKSTPPLLVGTILLLVIGGIILLVRSGADPEKPIPPTPASTVPTTTPSTSAMASTTILVFGDSITAGYGLPLADAYPSQLERILKERGYSVKVVNSGVSGETTAGGLRRAPFAASSSADIVILALGGNDVLRAIPPSSTKKNLEGMIEMFQARGSQVILAGMRAPSNLGDAYVKEFDAIYPALAKQYDLPLIPFLLDGVALDPALNQADGIHPNTEGAATLTKKNVLPVLLPLLPVK